MVRRLTKGTMVASPTKIRVLIADDEESVLRCYLKAFSAYKERQRTTELEELNASLFSTGVVKQAGDVSFDVVTCSQGNDSVALFREAMAEGDAFHAVILDVRMPPGISGVEAGRRIRELDANVILIFVTGFSDVAEEDLVRLIPPRAKLVYLSKPLSFRKLVLDLAALLT
jgi:CheY-like chemotaxis protein